MSAVRAVLTENMGLIPGQSRVLLVAALRPGGIEPVSPWGQLFDGEVSYWVGRRPLLASHRLFNDHPGFQLESVLRERDRG